MGGACLDGVMEMIHKIDVFYAQQFAFLVKQLDSITEGDKTLLDNTATVWMQEMSDGNSHNLNNLPILQAGSCAGYFKVGQAINVEAGKTDLTVGHSEEDCKNGQSPIGSLDSVGTPADASYDANQQILLQSDERDRCESRRGRIPGSRRHERSDALWQVR